MLGSLMGAVEQEKKLSDMICSRETNQKLSVKMKETVAVLAEHAKTSNELNQRVAQETSEIVKGTKVPVILTSRSDTFETKVNSIALAAVVAEEMKKSK